MAAMPSADARSGLAPSYAAVLRIPHARRAFGAAMLGRLSYGMVGLSLLLAVKSGTGSYAVAGTVMAVFGGTSVLLSPARAGLVDRYGPRRVLPPMVGLYALLLIGLAVATWRPGVVSGWWLGFGAAAAGACVTPVGPVMRALWSELAPDPALLQRAYSLDGVAEEIVFAVGPLLVGVLVGWVPPAAGVLVSAGLIWVGTTVLVGSPVVRRVREAGSEGAGESTGGAVFGGTGLWRAVVVAGGVGVALGGIDLLAVAFAEDRGRSAAVAWILAALSVGSAVGGLAHGAVSWRVSADRRLPLLALGLGASLAAAGLSPNLYVLAAAATLTGLFVAPAITTAYLLADAAATPNTRTRVGAWVNTTLNAGTSAGAAGTGALIAHVPLPLLFPLTALPILLTAASAALGAGVGRRGRTAARIG
ncbi:MFS transporter [Embleya hyalina]|uniref:MFS transporter n=1 Tax=Embleya hyalina TaxID=516124 RepID=A0A401YIJ0_9ACTN|nr:MFS transporter [Embleya hyalina]GCD94359.1 MFS transporter [Embleya hyalina]